ncbi:multiple epidermal growth factor-like domains protein 8 [Pezoporus occidentalis]|uniref:multiple epidermal growth factor-like domains protein 8 n=1 Tax=Pezoporus occidentalis TaxID=407982 RepID=UPI002F9126D3
MVLGGVTGGGAAADDAWVLELGGLRWRREEGPGLPLAGHSLTARGVTWLLLVGGASAGGGANTALRRFLLRERRWEEVKQRGTPPGALLGHSALYHPPLDALFVWGGQRPAGGASDQLHWLRCATVTWARLAPARGPRPQPHIFPAAALLGDVLVLLGGQGPTGEPSDALQLYGVRCNVWVTANRTRSTVTPQPPVTPPPPATCA